VAHRDLRTTLVDTVSEAVTRAVQQLIAEKHLYQSVTLPQDLVRGLEGNDHESQVLRILNADLRSRDWSPFLPADAVEEAKWISGTTPKEELWKLLFLVPHVRLYCGDCGRMEPFNPKSVAQVLKFEKSGLAGAAKRIVQVHSYTYECQGCRGMPHVVLVRRDGQKLTLSGRSPIEHVEVPSVIPKQIQRYYSNAIVAHQSGQTLSGLFQLRTCVEQWAYHMQRGSRGADEALEAYMLSLPDDFKARFPSLPKVYTDLSGALHQAREDAELFVTSADNIVEHFDARRVYKLPDQSEQTREK
jgi:hypothetical protein